MRELHIPTWFARSMVFHMTYSNFEFKEEVENWFTDNGYWYKSRVGYLMESIAEYFIEASEDTLVAFKLRWL